MATAPPFSAIPRHGQPPAPLPRHASTLPAAQADPGFPKFLYHKAHGAHLIKRAAELPQNLDEWFESPGEAERGEADPPTPEALQVGDGDVAGLPTGYVAEQYPKHLYQQNAAGVIEVRIVADPQAHAEAGAGWFESPDEAKSGTAAAPSTATLPALSLTEAEIASFYKAAQATAITRVVQVQSAALLNVLRAIERANPKVVGGRKKILQAIDNRLTLLEPVE